MGWSNESEQMFEHVVNSVYILPDDVISYRLHVFGRPLSGQVYDINSEVCGRGIEQHQD